MKRAPLTPALLLSASLALPAGAQTVIAPGVLRYGDVDCVNLACYADADPTDGATLIGLAPGSSTFGSATFAHSFPFDPEPDDFAGTDRIFVSSMQSATGDGYSVYSGRVAGPQLFTLDYSSLVPQGSSITSFTIGIMADDFQFPVFQNIFTAMINGSESSDLTAALNSRNQTGPITQFLTVGIDPLLLPADDHVLTLMIDEAAPGREGWAVDFLTIGVTTTASSVVPEPATFALVGGGLAMLLLAQRRRRRPG